MQSLKQHIAESAAMNAAKVKLKKMKKGASVSYTHQQSGEKKTGEYGGLRNMGGRSYAMVHHGKEGSTAVPVHQIHQAQ